MDYQRRIEKVREFIEKKKLQAVIIKSPSNIFYLTGLLEIEGVLFIDKKDITLFVPSLYHQEVIDLSHIKINTLIYKQGVLLKFLKGYKTVGFIDTEVTSSLHKKLSILHKGLIPLDDFIKKMRMVKEEAEIKLIKKALEINKKVFKEIEKEIEPGIEETVIAGRIHYLIRKYGGRREAFEPIVASGLHSSYPHHKNSNKAIEKGKPLIIDAGVDFNGYKSDLTRTFFPGGTKDKKFIYIYRTLEEIQKEVIDFIRPGMKGGKIHSYAVGLLKKKKLNRYFIHGLGHGVGIDVHELPVLAPGSKDIICEGCVFTIEPGVYIPGMGGIRLEEMAVL